MDPRPADDVYAACRSVGLTIEFNLAPDAIELASLDDLQVEVAGYEAVLQRAIRELVGHARTDGGARRCCRTMLMILV